MTSRSQIVRAMSCLSCCMRMDGSGAAGWLNQKTPKRFEPIPEGYRKTSRRSSSLERSLPQATLLACCNRQHTSRMVCGWLATDTQKHGIGTCSLDIMTLVLKQMQYKIGALTMSSSMWTLETQQQKQLRQQQQHHHRQALQKLLMPMAFSLRMRLRKFSMRRLT